MDEQELVIRRIKNLRWRRYLWVCHLIALDIDFCIFYGLFLRLMQAAGIDVERGWTIYGIRVAHLEFLFEKWSDLIEEAENKGKSEGAA
jgi:hypothetical protein